MAGRKQTRKRINAALASVGEPALAEGVPIPETVRQAQALATAALRRERKTKQQREARDRARAQAAVTAPEPAQVTAAQIKTVLTTLLNDIRAPALARIQAAKQLLEMSGTAPQFQKYTLEVRLTAYAENQYEADLARHRARVQAQGQGQVWQ